MRTARTATIALHEGTRGKGGQSSSIGAKVPNYEFSNSVEEFAIFAHHGPYGKKGLLGGAKESRKVVTVAACVCADCGHTELYCTALEFLQELARSGVVRELGA